MNIVCIRFGSQGRSLAPFAEACLQFTPQIAVREGEAVFLEIAGSRKLFSEAGLRLRIETLVRRFGVFPCRIAFGESPAMALAMTRFPSYARSRSLADLPLEGLPDYWSPFSRPEDEIRKKMENVITTLTQLGVRDVAEFVAIPVSSLASRFGKELVELSARILSGGCGGHGMPWPGFRPPERIFEKQDLSNESPGSLEALIFVLKGMIDRSMARLRGRGERASVVRVAFELERWSGLRDFEREWRVELPVPQGSSAGLLPIIQEQMNFELEREPLVAPVINVVFEVLETSPGRGSQRDFFCKKEEESEAWDSLVGRLSHKLGKESVFVAAPVERYLPEKAYQSTICSLEEVQKRVVPLPERPSRVLRQPERVERHGDVLLHPLGKRWRVMKWEGPERLTGEWWKQDGGFYRDYYQVATEEGERLWVFVNWKSEAPSLYLHGYFD